MISLKFKYFILILIFCNSMLSIGQVEWTRSDSSHVCCMVNFLTTPVSSLNNEYKVSDRQRIYIKSQSADVSILIKTQISNAVPVSRNRVIEDIAMGLQQDNNSIEPVSTLPTSYFRKKRIGHLNGWFYHQIDLRSIIRKNELCYAISDLTLDISGENIVSIIHGEIPLKLLLPVPHSTVSKVVPALQISDERLKMSVDSSRIVWIPRSLLKESGWRVGDIDPRYIKVSCQGREVPVVVSGENDGRLDREDGIEFFAHGLWQLDNNGMKQKPIYADENIYWIEISNVPGLRLGQEAAFGSTRPAWQTRYPRSAPVTIHIEENIRFHRLPYAVNTLPEDHWLMSSGIIGGDKKAIDFMVEQPDEYAFQSARLRGRMRSQTQKPGVFDLDIFINDKFLTTATWSGNSQILFDIDNISPNEINPGKNSVTLVNKSVEGALAVIYVDALELSYPRLLKADKNSINFNPPGNTVGQWVRYEVEGFAESEIRVMKPGISMLYGLEIDTRTDTTGEITYRLAFEDEIIDTDIEYYAYTLDSRWTPDSLITVTSIDLYQEAQNADYLVIIPDDSLGADILQPLIDSRKNQGFIPAILRYNDIVDAYNFGIPHARAIKNFLDILYRQRPLLQRYVMLVGDGHYNYRINTGETNLIPTPMYATYKFGAAAADHWYVCLDGDDAIPEMAIGRIPVSSVDELETVVAKLVDYDQQGPAPWRNRYLLIGSGGHNDIFRKQSENLISNVLGHTMTPERLYLAGSLSDPYVGGTEDLLRHLRDGVSIVNFRGHGGGAIWADAGLLDLDDIPLLENRKKLPFISSMTCFTADFSSTRSCLGEAMLCDTDAGAAALWGASGVGWVYNDFYLLKELYGLITTHPDYPMGLLIQMAKSEYLDKYYSNLALGEVYQYNLLGDPAMRLGIPSIKLDINLDSKVKNDGESLLISGQTTESYLNIKTEITKKGLHTLTVSDEMISGGTWQLNQGLPVDLEPQNNGVRLYAWNSETGYHSSAFLNFNLDEAYFDSLLLSPGMPLPGTQFRITALVEGNDGIKQAWCNLIHPVQDSLAMQPAEKAGMFQSTEIGPFDPGNTVIFSIGVIDGLGRSSISDTVTIRLMSQIDLAVRGLDFVSDDKIVMQSTILNFGDTPAEKAIVRFLISELNWTHDDTVSIAGGESIVAKVAYPPYIGRKTVKVHVDPLLQLAETQIKNNISIQSMENSKFYISPENGSELNGNGPFYVGLNNEVMINVPPQAVHSKIILNLERNLSGSDIHPVYNVKFSAAEENVQLTKSASIFISTQNTDTTDYSQIYHRLNDSDPWIAINTTRNDTAFSAEIVQSGFYQVQHNGDQTPPQIEIQVEDQLFGNGSYVSSTAKIHILLEDESGVDMRTGALRIYINGSLLPEQSIMMADSLSELRHVMVSIQPRLASGEHEISVEAADIHGNLALGEPIAFKMANGLKIEYLGNHPNPFKRETVFVYNLTDGARSVSIKIYTTDGRLIKTFDDALLAGADYHEVRWDGMDEWNEPVANGVYFFRIKARGYSRTDEFTGKIAKIR